MKETLLLTKHMRENPENSHLIEVYEKNNGYSAARKVFKENNPGDVIAVSYTHLTLPTSDLV